jgi:hypothetical protein
MPKKKVIPMKPPRPEQNVPVMRKSKPHYRSGRGTITPAVLNNTMQSQANAAKIAMPAAKQLLLGLERHIGNMKRGSLQATMGLRMAGELRTQGYIDYRSLMNLEAQKEYPLAELLKVNYRLIKEEGQAGIELQLPRGVGVRVRSGLISAYQVKAILVSGDVTDTETETEVSEQSSIMYPVSSETETVCRLLLEVPDSGVPWMLWLRVECFEGDEPAIHPMYRRMKVVGTGRD